MKSIPVRHAYRQSDEIWIVAWEFVSNSTNNISVMKTIIIHDLHSKNMCLIHVFYIPNLTENYNEKSLQWFFSGPQLFILEMLAKPQV